MPLNGWEDKGALPLALLLQGGRAKGEVVSLFSRQAIVIRTR